MCFHCSHNSVNYYYYFSERSSGWSNGGWLCTFTSHLKQSRVSLTPISGFYLLQLVKGMHVITIWLMKGKQGNISEWFLSCLKHTNTHWGTLLSCFFRSAIATLIKRQLHFWLHNKNWDQPFLLYPTLRESLQKSALLHLFDVLLYRGSYKALRSASCLLRWNLLVGKQVRDFDMQHLFRKLMWSNFVAQSLYPLDIIWNSYCCTC